MKSYQKRLLNGIVAVVLIVSIVFSIGTLVGKAADCTVSITTDKSSVNVGETFNVTVSVSGADVGVLKGNLIVSGGASTGDTLVYLYKTYTSATYSFQATSAGNVTISMDVSTALFFSTEQEMADVDVGECVVMVVEPTTAPPETTTTAEETTTTAEETTTTVEETTTTAEETTTTIEETTTTGALSSNAYLEALSIYPGSLSPAFNPKTYIYEVTVKNDVTKLSVSAATADVDASYIITDTNLEVGRNVIDIKVTAADGTVQWYAIRVDRLAAETTQAETTAPETTAQSTAQEQTEATESSAVYDPLEVVVGNVTAYVQETLGNVEMPEGFEEVDYEFKGVAVEALKGLGNSLILIPVSDGTGINLYIYNEEKDGLYPYVGIQITSALYTVLPFDDEEQMPEGYQLTVIEFNDTLIDAWVRADAEDNRFVLFYAVNWEGTTGLYRYDAEENTLQRVNKDELFTPTAESESQQETESVSQSGNNQSGAFVDDEYLAFYEETLKKVNQRDTIMFIMMIILLMCLIAMYLLFASGKKDEPEDPDDDPDDDLEDDPDDDSEEESEESAESDDSDEEELSDVFEDDIELSEDNTEEAADSDAEEFDESEAFQKELEQIQLGMAGIIADFGLGDVSEEPAAVTDEKKDSEHQEGAETDSNEAEDTADQNAVPEAAEMDLEDLELEELDLEDLDLEDLDL